MQTFKDYLKLTEAIFKLETEIIIDKLKLGCNGVEWLVLQINLDNDRRKSMEDYIKLASDVFKKNIEHLFSDALKMDNDSFYEKHELNWWIAIDEALTYLALLKQKNYNRYFEYLQNIFEEGEE